MKLSRSPGTAAELVSPAFGGHDDRPTTVEHLVWEVRVEVVDDPQVLKGGWDVPLLAHHERRS